MSSTPPISRNTQVIAVAFFIVFSSVVWIIAATGFVRLPVDRNAVAVRYHSRRIVRWWAGRGHSRAVNVAARRAGQLANALHLLPHGGTAHDAVGVKLYPHCLGVEVIEIDLNLKYVLCRFVCTFTSPKCSAAHFCSRVCCQLTICLPIAPLSAVR